MKLFNSFPLGFTKSALFSLLVLRSLDRNIYESKVNKYLSSSGVVPGGCVFRFVRISTSAKPKQKA